MPAPEWGDSDIAVVGMAGRFPGANTIDQFWQNLCDGVESIHFPDDQELIARGVDPATLDDPRYVKAASVMDGVELFDAGFFGYTPREAELMDPQHRVFLECAWETLEHAGYDPERYRGAIGVWGGGTTNTYLLYNLVSNREALGAFDPMQIDVSNGPDFVTTRVSYKLNLRGPSMTVQTACSTALVAIHMACQALLNEECDMALAGGVSVHVHHPNGYWYAEGGNVSPDGHCRAFDADGAGTIFGSGVGAVLLKRMEDAIADGDHIHAVVKGSALNNDGSGKVGFTAPSVEGQAGVISEALALADVKPGTIRYVETHGTATRLGDPIEVRALTKAYRAHTDARHICAIGSVKTNVGHLASAAGVASFIKTVMMLERQRIPPSLHFTRPNPEIDFDSSPFYVNTTLSEWPAGRTPRRAGISSFGVGGTNAHAILEEAPQIEPSGPSRSHQLLLLSAKSGAALDRAAANLADHLRQHPEQNLADAAFTLQVGRQAFQHRRIVVARDRSEAIAALESGDGQRSFSATSEITQRPVAFLFPGMGDQYVDMALELYQSEPVFRTHVDHCAELLIPLIGSDLREALYPNGTQPRAATPESNGASSGQIDLRQMLRRDQPTNGSAPINQTRLGHPILFTIEYALAQLWMSWGIKPQVMIGHSIGEYVAATIAGVFALDDALRLIAKRAQLIGELPGGAMLAVLAPEAEIQPWLGERLSLAAVNTPQACVVSGDSDAIAELERALLGRGIACQRVQTTHAFHSHMMAPIEEPLRALLSQLRLSAPTIPFYSNVTGQRITAAEATDPAYWARHMRHTVRFNDGIEALLRQPNLVLLEMGPGLTITAFAKQHPAHTAEHVVLASLRQPSQAHSDVGTLLHTLGRLWIAGVTISWTAFYRNERRLRVPLPTYPFERQRYWIEPATTSPTVQSASETGVERSAEIADWFYTPTWKRSLRPAQAQHDSTAAPVHWLVLTDRDGIAEALADRLAAGEHPVVRVRCADQFARLDDTSYALDPARRDDWSRLLSELAVQDIQPNRIVHCAALGGESATFSAAQQPGAYSLIALAQALDEHGAHAPIGVAVVSSGVCPVESSDAIDPARTTILSPCRVIPQEYPHITCRLIDVAPASDRLVDQLLAELLSDAADAVVAYRGTRRWTQSYEPVRLEIESRPLRPLRNGGTYVVTDGLAGVGWALAQHLARAIHANLALIERPEFPAQDRWHEWLGAHDEHDPISRKIRQAQALEQHGAQILVLRADPADAHAIRQALLDAADRFGAVHGLIHALGSGDGEHFSPLQDLNEAAFEQQVLPTERSLAALAEALSGAELDFVALIGSLSSVLGGLGQATHAAASLLIDAVAEQQSQRERTPWLSIDWDVWRPDGEQIAVNAAIEQFAITPADGVEAAQRLLTQLPGSRIVVSTGTLNARIRQRPHAFMPPSMQDGALQARHPRPQLSSPYVAPRTELERKIMSTWQEIFGLEQIGIDDNFFELGGNSLIAIHSMVRLKKVLEADIPTAVLYQRPTIRFLAELLAQDEEQSARQMAERLAKRKADLGRRNQVLQRRR